MLASVEKTHTSKSSEAGSQASTVASTAASSTSSIGTAFSSSNVAAMSESIISIHPPE